MPRILANDGIQPIGKDMLEAAGFEVITDKIEQDDLPARLNEFDGILVRSATKVRQELIDQAPNLKLIGRGGVGMDNIDVDYARSKGIAVVNTPAASSQSVAELVFAHMFSCSRFLYDSNRKMPVEQDNFKGLKKAYSKGIELRGKSLGIIGFGRIGQTVARMGLGLGMNIIPFKLHHDEVKIEVDFFKIEDATVNIRMKTDSFDYLLEKSDFITLHVPFPPGAEPILYKERFDKMKDGVGIVNTSRGGTIVEKDLLGALDSGKVAWAGLDVYENEPTPDPAVLSHPRISLTPHIGASTVEAQARVWSEMAERVIAHFREQPATA